MVPYLYTKYYNNIFNSFEFYEPQKNTYPWYRNTTIAYHHKVPNGQTSPTKNKLGYYEELSRPLDKSINHEPFLVY